MHSVNGYFRLFTEYSMRDAPRKWMYSVNGYFRLFTEYSATLWVAGFSVNGRASLSVGP